MKNNKKSLEKKLLLLEQKRFELEDVYPSSNQVNLLLSEIDYFKAEILKIELQKEYKLIEDEDN
jgi:hypothetical protein